jgi:hypothetical protein
MDFTYFAQNTENWITQISSKNTSGCDLDIGRRESCRMLGPKMLADFIGQAVFRRQAVISCVVLTSPI